MLASVLDHGLSWIEPFASDPTVKWFETLRNKMGASCCGLGDAYEIQIDVKRHTTKHRPGRCRSHHGRERPAASAYGRNASLWQAHRIGTFCCGVTK